MKLIIDKKAIDKNIRQAEELAGVQVSIMLKNFYEYLYTDEMKSRKIFSANIKGSVCYSIGDARNIHCGAVITSKDEAKRHYSESGITMFFIPINAYDNREGLSIPEVMELAHSIQGCGFSVFGMITSGCINDDSPWSSYLCIHNKLSLNLNFTR